MTTDPDFAAMRQRCENYENMTALEGDDVQPEDESLLRQMRHEAVRDLPIALARIEQQEREIAEIKKTLAKFLTVCDYREQSSTDQYDDLCFQLYHWTQQPTAPQPGDKGE